jgi:hypothetical protein
MVNGDRGIRPFRVPLGGFNYSNIGYTKKTELPDRLMCIRIISFRTFISFMSKLEGEQILILIFFIKILLGRRVR